MHAPAIQTQLRIAAMFEAREDRMLAQQEAADEAYEAMLDAEIERVWQSVEASDVLAELTAGELNELTAGMRDTDDVDSRAFEADLVLSYRAARHRLSERLARANLAKAVERAYRWGFA